MDLIISKKRKCSLSTNVHFPTLTETQVLSKTEGHRTFQSISNYHGSNSRFDALAELTLKLGLPG